MFGVWIEKFFGNSPPQIYLNIFTRRIFSMYDLFVVGFIIQSILDKGKKIWIGKALLIVFLMGMIVLLQAKAGFLALGFIVILCFDTGIFENKK